MKVFQKEKIISPDLFRRVTTVRVESPGEIARIAGKRNRRDTFVPDARINIVAADHPARGSVSVGNEPFAMANRHDLLARLVHTLRSPWVDGVLASMDILEELLILHGTDGNESGFLDEKLLIASLNRGGHPGTAWELNDPVTGTDGRTCSEMGIDAAKMLLRVDPEAEESLKTISHCAEGVREMNRYNLPLFLEPLPVEKTPDGYRVVNDPLRLIPLMSVTSALGNSSRNLWLKIPYTKQFDKVLAATTLPVVILGGDRTDSTEALLQTLKKALECGHQVRGAMFGRNVLYPKNKDPRELAEEAGKIVHAGEPR